MNGWNQEIDIYKECAPIFLLLHIAKIIVKNKYKNDKSSKSGFTQK